MTKSFVNRWLCALAMFDVTRFPAYDGALDVILIVLSLCYWPNTALLCLCPQWEPAVPEGGGGQRAGGPGDQLAQDGPRQEAPRGRELPQLHDLATQQEPGQETQRWWYSHWRCGMEESLTLHIHLLYTCKWSVSITSLLFALYHFTPATGSDTKLTDQHANIVFFYHISYRLWYKPVHAYFHI